jgi:plastocyanin
MLHHIVYKDLGRFNGDRHDPVCGGRAESFYGNGEEDETLHFPPGYGYPIHRGDRWQTGWMLMNHRNQVDRAYIEYTVTIDTVHKLTPVRPYWLRVTGCPRPGRIDPIFNVPGGGRRGSRYAKSVTWKMPEAGRLIAASGHAHGGSQDLVVKQPRCGDRRLLTSKPLFGRPDHPYYHVLPVLHEPGPINMSWHQTKTGIPVGKGERLKLTSYYDDRLVHTRVMGIMHLYVSPDPSARTSCKPLPADLDNQRLNYAGRTRSPAVRVPLTGLDRNGRARRISKPPGRRRHYDGNATVLVRSRGFVRPNLSVPLGARVRWLFRDKASHNVTLANGPRGFASQNHRRGRTYNQRLRRPGVYRLFCSLHPTRMTQIVTVR